MNNFELGMRNVELGRSASECQPEAGRSLQISHSTFRICELARKALPLMSANARAEAEGLIKTMGGMGSLGGMEEPVAAFESDMRPVREAIVSALVAGDVEALRGLRALLPHLLAEVNESPALADLLAHQLGKSFLAGLKAEPEETL